MYRAELFFDLPKKLIAQQPAEPRDSCRLMVLDRKSRSIEHDVFFHLGSYLRPGDVLVMNQSKVLPARLEGTVNGVKKEVLLLREQKPGSWEVLVGGKIRLGDIITFSKKLSATVAERGEGIFVLHFTQTGEDFLQTIQAIGKTPTPPYIKKMVSSDAQYQTVFAKELGSAAAPTAGLHFTKELLSQLKEQGVEQEFITLHVGLGTFQPVKSEIVEQHKIHSEWFTVDRKVFERLKQAKSEGRRIIAVGTTTVRVLETIFDPKFLPSDESFISGETAIFIYPGFTFRAVDALITNFHTPYSSLLALVYAFAGQDFIRMAYQEAVANEYRFFSFGDAMFIV